VGKHLSISAFAWPQSREKEGIELAHELGVQGIEVPYFRYGDVYDGVVIPAFQAIVPSEMNDRLLLMDHLYAIAEEVKYVSVPTVVFGAKAARELVKYGPVLFLQTILPMYEAFGVNFAIENMTGAPWGFSMSTVLGTLVNISSPFVGLAVDTGALNPLTAPQLPQVVPAEFHASWRVKHVHLSEPGMQKLGTNPKTPHAAVASALKNYDGWLSIEQHALPGDNWREDMKQAVEFAKRVYL